MVDPGSARERCLNYASLHLSTIQYWSLEYQNQKHSTFDFDNGFRFCPRWRNGCKLFHIWKIASDSTLSHGHSYDCNAQLENTS